ncbi:MAG: hypothetical protein AB7F75_01275 [Planctomycetota bacterium]
MNNILENGSNWLEDMRHEHTTKLVRYKRGPVELDIQATIGKTIFKLGEGLGAEGRVVSRDYLVRAEDFAALFPGTTPLRGDRIIEERGTIIMSHEVLAPGGEPHFRESDLYGKTLRIHTKLVKVENAP